MCGRYALYSDGERLKALLQLDNELPEIPESYNLCPSRDVVVVRPGKNGGREGVLLKWGLVPSWAKDEAIGNKLANARSETAHSKPSFRSAFKSRRCVVPADGYYEWKKDGRLKVPYYFHAADGSPLLFAAIWERWERDGRVIESVALLTTRPNAMAAKVHDRMPVLLRKKDVDLWLDESVKNVDALAHLLEPADEAVLETYPVATAVNNPRNDGPELIRPDKPPIGALPF